MLALLLRVFLKHWLFVVIFLDKNGQSGCVRCCNQVFFALKVSTQPPEEMWALHMSANQDMLNFCSCDILKLYVSILFCGNTTLQTWLGQGTKITRLGSGEDHLLADWVATNTDGRCPRVSVKIVFKVFRLENFSSPLNHNSASFHCFFHSIKPRERT